jgi:hypothetical protein
MVGEGRELALSLAKLAGAELAESGMALVRCAVVAVAAGVGLLFSVFLLLLSLAALLVQWGLSPALSLFMVAVAVALICGGFIVWTRAQLAKVSLVPVKAARVLQDVMQSPLQEPSR